MLGWHRGDVLICSPIVPAGGKLYVYIKSRVTGESGKTSGLCQYREILVCGFQPVCAEQQQPAPTLTISGQRMWFS